MPSLDSAGNISLTSKGKPINVNQIFQYAKNVVQIADKGINPYYRVDSGTVMGVYNGSLRLKRIQDLSLISFNLGVGELATERGFLNYLMAFDRFYESEPYQKNGMEGIKPTDFSAGFSLPVFVQMGLIESINGIKPGSPIFKTVLAHTVHSAAVGISLSLMEECGISIERQTNEWPWLQSVSENALSGINNNEKH